MPRLLLLVGASLLAACGVQRPIEEQITIEFDEEDGALLSIETTYDPGGQPRSIAQRVERAREAALADRDEWAVRLARVTPDAEQTIFERRKGLLERSSRHARIPASDLPSVFADLPLTMLIAPWERGRELIIYPGSSTRATREQRDHFAREVDLWSKAAARYFTAAHQLYSYLEEQSPRAPYVFAALFNEKAIDGVPVGVIDTEQALLDGVTAAMSEILDRMDAGEPQQYTLGEEADLIFNPFPGRVRVKVPGDIVALEGFEKTTEREVTVEPVDLLRAVASLEGKWISPDPLALLLQSESGDSQLPAGAEVAAIPRKSTSVVSAGEIERAVLEALRRASTYRVRWVE